MFYTSNIAPISSIEKKKFQDVKLHGFFKIYCGSYICEMAA